MRQVIQGADLLNGQQGFGYGMRTFFEPEGSKDLEELTKS